MPFLLATDPARVDRDNEDFAAVTPNGAVLLDGVSTPSGTDIGCQHGVAWYARRLGGLLVAHLEGNAPLREGLAEAITTVSSLHGPGCDLANQECPSATVVMVRFNGAHLEYLVLSDSVLLAEHEDGHVSVFTDTRLDDLKAELAATPLTTAKGTPEREHEVHRRAHAIYAYRNVPGGFWTAGADPRAAQEAITGTLALEGVLSFVAMSDGATRGVEVFDSMTWEDCLTMAVKTGPAALIDHVRERERADPDRRLYPRGKVHDDATAITWTTA